MRTQLSTAIGNICWLASSDVDELGICGVLRPSCDIGVGNCWWTSGLLVGEVEVNKVGASTTTISILNIDTTVHLNT